LDHFITKHPQELGKIDDYEQCAFITPGIGQFKPGPTANPIFGTVRTWKQVEEDGRVELVVNDQGAKVEFSNAI
ncbi:hypothetical protein PAXINDRAFT_76965, partial [Paxillus involutus ATCC 200175]